MSLLAFFLAVLSFLIASGTLIGIALGLTGVVALAAYLGVPPTLVAQISFRALNSYPLLAIPFFIYAGNLILEAGLAEDLMRGISLLLRRIRGGMPITIMVASVFFAAVSGSSAASAAAIGRNAVALMRKENYPEKFIAGSVAAGGTIGLMIPPSLSFVLIGAMMDLPVITLFTAGILPGVLEGVILATIAWVISARRGWGIYSRDPVQWREVGRALLRGLGVLLAPVVILGGLYSGVFTPTEVAAASAFYALVLSALVHRSLDWRRFVMITQISLYQSGMIYLIVIGGNILTYVLVRLGITDVLLNTLKPASLQAWQFLVVTGLMYVVLGMFLDGISLLVLTVPLVFPLAQMIGVNLIQFAVVVTSLIELATITPPVGLNLYVMSGVTGLKVEEVTEGVLVYYPGQLLYTGLLMFVPWLSLALI